MAETLEKLFGSSARVKLLRLFLFNTRQEFTAPEVARRTHTLRPLAKRELELFVRIGLLIRSGRKKVPTYMVNPDFSYLTTLQNLLLNTPSRGRDIHKYIQGSGSVRLIVMGGVFLGEEETGLDLFVVGDRMKEKKFKKSLELLEAEIGKELRYALLPTDEFFYRLNMNDRLVRDVFDYPHRVVYDRLDIGLK
jgi:hypothetical protein